MSTEARDDHDGRPSPTVDGLYTPSDAPPPVPNKEGLSHYLFGFPILHSASPAFHNLLFTHSKLHAPPAGSSEVAAAPRTKTYSLRNSTSIDPRLLEIIRGDGFGGASVTMPLKVSVLPFLDRLTDEARAIGAVNTIVVERLPSGPALVGTNTDFLGVRNAILSSLGHSAPFPTISFPRGRFSALIIGSGGTSRSALYALASLGLEPIHLVNRDLAESRAVVAAFPQLDVRILQSLADVEGLGGGNQILVGVGCVPAVEAKTEGELDMWRIVKAVLSRPFVSLDSNNGISSEGQTLEVPTSRPFLDMCYKPRQTPLLTLATAHGWAPIGGIEAMVEQGLAQSRMWAAGSASAHGQRLELEVEAKAGQLVRGMADIPA